MKIRARETSLASVSEEEKSEAEICLKRLMAVNTAFEKRADSYKKRKDRVEDRIIYKSPANVELDVRVSGGSHRAPQEATLSFIDEGYMLSILQNDLAELERVLKDALKAAANCAGENKGLKVLKALRGYYFEGLYVSELPVSDRTFKKYKDIALRYAALSIRTLKATGNTALQQFEEWK